MKYRFFNPGAGLIRSAQTGYWLSLLLFFILIITSFLLFENQINNTLSTINRNLQDGSLFQAAAVIILVGLLAFDILLPVPSSLVALVAVTTLGVAGGTLTIFVGLCLGAILGYFLGAGYVHLLTRWLSSGERNRAAKFSLKLTPYALVLLRGVPVLAEISVLAAGISRYSFRRFLLITTLANFGLAMAYGYIGSTLAGQESVVLAIFACMLLPGLLFIIHLLYSRFKPGFENNYIN